MKKIMSLMFTAATTIVLTLPASAEAGEKTISTMAELDKAYADARQVCQDKFEKEARIESCLIDVRSTYLDMKEKLLDERMEEDRRSHERDDAPEQAEEERPRPSPEAEPRDERPAPPAHRRVSPRMRPAPMPVRSVERPGQFAAFTYEPEQGFFASVVEIWNLQRAARRRLQIERHRSISAKVVVVKNGIPLSVGHPAPAGRTSPHHFYADLNGDGQPELVRGADLAYVDKIYVPWTDGDQGQIWILRDTGRNVVPGGRRLWGNPVKLELYWDLRRGPTPPFWNARANQLSLL